MTLEVNHTYPRYITGIFFISFLLFSCSFEKEENLIEIQGQAQGTYYSVKYLADHYVVDKSEIDSLFDAFDSSLSTYQDYSLISQFNDQDSLHTSDEWFIEMIKQSEGVYYQTNGLFDPTVLPLVKAWGFGPEERRYESDEPLDSVLQRIGWTYLEIEEGNVYWTIKKKKKGVQLDFNAIAQGYMSDVIASYLNEKGIDNYLIDSGGELKAKGHNQKGKIWTIGIDSPEENAKGRSLIATIQLNNSSVATSGNYRKFYIEDGVKYSHTISPKTGKPVDHSLLSVTVVTDSCSLADAYATALMVMGTEKAIDFIESKPNLEAYLIYADEDGRFNGYISQGLNGIVKEIE